MCDKDKKRACGKAGGVSPRDHELVKVSCYPTIQVSSFTVNIGENVIIRQNTTTGEKVSDTRENYIVTGDNIDTGARACITGLNVKNGALSFIMENVPDNCTYVTRTDVRGIRRDV